MQTAAHTIGSRRPQAPGALRLALEMRVPWEFGASLLALPILKSAPRGDGHAVLVFPGLVASDMSTAPLRQYLNGQGYDARGWDLGRNLGPGRGKIEACFDKVRELHKETGRTISLIGWSLGGIYAREAAKVVPECVRSVITLGTPFNGHPKSTNAWRVYEMASGETADTRLTMYNLSKAPPAPTTSIYSRTDGVVAYECSQQSPTGRRDTENIEVEASHIGLGVNPCSLYAVADRLAQPEGNWQPFDRGGLLKSMLFGDPARTGWMPRNWFV
jgi:pimeloyl-ACP methyl ester carboxylesterase